MRITQISLTNFRSFKETQVFDLAPVTLIFGPNSAGKSSIFSALFYVQQILEKGQCNPMYIDALGKKYVGGFINLVHKRNLESTIKIKIKYELEKQSEGASYGYLYDLIESELDITLASPIEQTQTISIELEIAWCKRKKDAYVKAYVVEFEDDEIAVIEIIEDKPTITWLNYIHNLMWPKNHSNWLKSFKVHAHFIHSYNFLTIHGIDVYASPLPDQLINIGNAFMYLPESTNIDRSKGIIEQLEALTAEDRDSQLMVTDTCYVSALHRLINSKHSQDKPTEVLIDNTIGISSIHDYEFRHFPIKLLEAEDALPPIGRKLKCSLNIEDIKKQEIVSELLSDILVAPLDNLLAILNKSISIGPIRKIIDANYQPLPYIEQKDWFDGSAAWSYLEQADLDTLKKIHTWMSDEDKLNLGYGIALKEVQSTVKTFNINNTSSKIDADNRLEVKVYDKPDFISSNEGHEEKKYRYTIIDKFNQIPVTPSEVGTGVSQLMPLIIAAVSQEGGIVACEQPELHLHPRIQVAIADLLTQNIDNVNYLVETHSEHLILRLLKRIRQHTDNELPEGLDFIKKNDVAIIYLEPTKEGVIANKIGITEDGEFTDNWPHGFFSERRQELM
ncbi:AAA family ATPase [Psychrobacter sanguinis]|uniref:AAA family ATPase n=1 Tax=Psychrobacter sanguinis TaxID=861445 RepID=A0A844M305_9GAMM|nr:DUF3696 domain-containing protein [Psychrobacter sanguinis]MUG33321.1 AAA family ATPase [Psychrobacter sanguinis]